MSNLANEVGVNLPFCGSYNYIALTIREDVASSTSRGALFLQDQQNASMFSHRLLCILFSSRAWAGVPYPRVVTTKCWSHPPRPPRHPPFSHLQAVMLNIYDLTGSNDWTTPLGFGFFHSGIEVRKCARQHATYCQATLNNDSHNALS